MIRTVGVIVPAANEQADIGDCLDALARARAHLRESATHDIDVRTVVVLDCCIDQTAAIVAQAHSVETIACSIGRAGAARAIGAQHLLRSTAAAPHELWLANTDADSTVPADWLTVQLDEADQGAHLVLGTVLPAPGLPYPIERAWHERHQLRDGHPHVHGANLGIRADTYLTLGGWTALADGEDTDLAARAAAVGQLRITRTASIPVTTSSRLHGRAGHGFAAYLRRLTVTEPATG